MRSDGPQTHTPRTPAPSSGTNGLGVGSFVRTTSRIDTYVEPTTESPPFVVVEREQQAYVADLAPGDWYLIEFPTSEHGLIEEVFGWAQAEVLAPYNVAESCPDREAEVIWVGALTPAERLACIGGQTFELRGYLVNEPPTAEPLYDGDPPWLAMESSYILLGNPGPAITGGRIAIHIPPQISAPQSDRWVTVRGHFDDAAHATVSADRPGMGYQNSEARSRSSGAHSSSWLRRYCPQPRGSWVRPATLAASNYYPSGALTPTEPRP
jgi:hypothetical protein